MIRVGRIILPLLLSIALSAPLFAQRPQRRSPNFGEIYTVEFEVRRFRSDLVSELRVSGNGVPGSTFDPVSDLGLPNERIVDFHVAIRILDRLKIRGTWFKRDYVGESISGEERAIAGLVVPAGSTLESSLELEQRRGGAEFDVFRGEYGFLAVVGEFARFDARSKFSAGEGAVEPERLRLDLPLFGLKGRVYLTPALGLSLEGIGMKRESRGVMTEFEASATYNLIPNIGLSYGYRNSYNRFKSVEPDGDRAVFRLRGQYFSVSIRF